MPANTTAEIEYQSHHSPSPETVKPTKDDVVRRYRESRHWRLYPKEFMFHHINALAPKHICDFGCGDGETSVELALLGYRVTGLDLSPDLIAVAEKRAELDGVTDRVGFVTANGSASPLKESKFDLVLAQSVLHHMDLNAGLAAIDKLLSPEGHAVIREPIALSPLLQWIRDRIPVTKDVSPNEKQLTTVDLHAIRERFEVRETRFFAMLSRLVRLIPEPRKVWQNRIVHLLYAADSVLLSVPSLHRFAGNVVLVCRKRRDS